MISQIQGVLVITAIFVVLGLFEAYRHRRNLRSIRLRIHVNGTRGKSSVTRLIAAGLREAGVRTCAKTTGTLARFIMPDGRELPVFRPSKANVLEQLRIVAAAASQRADALVIECMALQPEYQWLCEDKFVRATHGVITNVRPDHLDVMGPDEYGVATALAGMTPQKGTLYTATQRHADVLKSAADDRGSKFVLVGDEARAQVSEADLAGFSYREHPDNVALALRVLEDVGVSREVALRGMWRAKPDPGAMTEHHLDFFGRRLIFVNAFAANDPESTEQLWRMMIERHPEVTRRVAVFNLRADRADRSRQLGEAYARWPQADDAVLMGTGTYIFARSAVENGCNGDSFVFAEDADVAEIFERIIELVDGPTLVMGMANIGGAGLDLVRFVRNREIIAPRRENLSMH